MLKISRGKQRLLNYLGEPYTVKEIDLENCVYLDLKNGYDVEISGGKTIKSKFDIYVWRTKGGYEIVEKHFDIKPDLEDIKALLDDIRARYSNIN
ncbi:hypothetical protein Q428_04685 [Fervidicella metallireducens AeB]|uniref:Uncharacterized protein n=1 Tax=Fervidicella metallireducens AeB TaxID=1403537 RepID=A0A017RXJ5_9CLOT|nr:hypothetical protein [Fervidicella metallireducens]EYE89104.1 hypothetical protein Q428_04685 [Fervidicella metallireducens AeB]